MQIETQALAGIWWIDYIRRRLAPALRSVALADSQALLLADRLHFPRPLEFVGPGALHRHVGARNGANDVVFALDLIEVRALAEAESSLDQNAVCAGGKRSEFRVQLDGVYVVGPIYRVDRPVAVKQNGEIVNPLFDPALLPRASRVGGPVNLETKAVHVGEDVIGSLVVTETRRPDAAAVDLLAVFETEIGAEVQAVKGIANDAPVHQIAGVQNGQPRHGVHGGARQVVVLAHANHVGVGELVVEQGV